MPPETHVLDAVLPPLPLDVATAFGRALALEVDVGCGKGRFLLARAAAFPDTAFLGIERRRKRVEKVNRKLLQAGLLNARLLHEEAAFAVEERIPPDAVRAYYIFFPDPWPKRRHHRRRLFSPAFMDSLHRTLRPGGRVHIATDHADYYAWIRALFGADVRFRETAPFQPAEEERTEFELTFTALGCAIHRCSFERQEAGPPPGREPPRPPRE